MYIRFRSLVIGVMASVIVSGCSKSDAPSSPPSPPPSGAPQISVPTAASPSTPAAPPAPSAPLPGTPTTPAPATKEGPVQPGESVAPQFSGTTEAERLTWAIRAYYEDSSRPALTSFEPLVALKIIRAVPQAPAGKKYVIDMSKLEVRLE